MAIDLVNQSNVLPLQHVTPVRRVQNESPGPGPGPEQRQAAAASGKESPPGERTLDAPAEESAARAVVDLNNYVQKVGREIRFTVDGESGETVIKVMNSKTDEVIRQIPSEELLALARFVRDSMALPGTGLSEKA